MFAARLRKTHGKQIIFAVRLVLAHGKDNAQTNGCEREYHPVGEKCLPCAKKKTHVKLFLCRALRENARQTFFLPNVFFAVRYGENAR
jgi:hypothetical protein